MLANLRGRALLVQFAVLSVVVAVFAIMAKTAIENLESRGIPLGMEFLGYRAGFTIPESFLPYSTDDVYLWAIIVGIGNTIVVSLIVAVLCTFFGVILGISRLSNNPLIRGLSRVWIETARNTPPILMLIFLYSLWWNLMPQVKEAWELFPGIFLSIRGLAIPTLSFGWSATWILVSVALFVATILIARNAATEKQKASGERPRYVIYTVLGTFLLIALILLIAPDKMMVEWPHLARTRFEGGYTLTPELVTIIVGLTYYTAGFVAEIVRAGILSVPKGQWEAARALGLKERRILSLIIIPQTLRVIVPPMTSQYINLVKNSTLAIAVGFPDFMVTMTTIINRTSHAFEGVAIIVVVYLVINLSLSMLLNYYNRRLVQR